MRNDKDNLIINLTFEFALKIINFCDGLKEDKRYEIASQLIRSGISIGANTREAQNAESKLDFIHKLKIAAKEADEVEFYLQICEQLGYQQTEGLMEELQSIIKVLSKIISTSKNK